MGKDIYNLQVMQLAFTPYTLHFTPNRQSPIANIQSPITHIHRLYTLHIYQLCYFV